MGIISLVNQKGGCGKTTTAVNLASAMARQGLRVLLIDLDPQAHATFSLGVTPRLTTADLLENFVNKNSVDIDSYLILRRENLFFLGSSIGLSALESSLSTQADKLEILSRLLDTLDNRFDYYIIDCPPNLGVLTLNALMASTTAIVPIGICEFSLKGVENLNQILNMLSERYGRIPAAFYLVTQLDKRLKFSENFVAKIKQRFDTRLLSTMIRTNVHLREAAACGKDIFEYKRDSRGAEDYRDLAKEIEVLIKSPSRIQLFLKDKLFNEVYLVGDFNDWCKTKAFGLKQVDPQTWSIALPLKKGTYRYKFVADDLWFHDPDNSLTENDKFGGKNSILFVR